ncbi:MAG: hypothetical protein DRP83_00695 [Planctomycetota bacterium]|nr:MAG: hypothetical protein DRP83_00695 [Planctomycetota bacterium]
MKARTDVLVEIRSAVETLLKNAAEFKDRFRKDPINWGDLHCTEVLYCLDDEGHERYQVHIAECDPACGELKRYIIESLQSHYDENDEFEVITEW